MEHLCADLAAKDGTVASQLQRINELTSELASCQEQAERQASVAVQSGEELTGARQEIVKIQNQVDAEKSECVKFKETSDVLVSCLKLNRTIYRT